MNGLIELLSRRLVETILDIPRGVPSTILDQAESLNRVFKGVDVSFNCFEALHERFGNFTPYDYRRAQTLITIGRKIEAIKIIREMTSLALKEAKDLAESDKYFIQPPAAS